MTFIICHPRGGEDLFSSMNQYWVYILGNAKPVLYIGVTNNLERRIFEHRNKSIDGFSKEYNLTKLLYMESFNNIEDAIYREKQLKHWNRQWKLNLIKSKNPEFKDLFKNTDPRSGRG